MVVITNESPTLTAVCGLHMIEEGLSLTNQWIIRARCEYSFTPLLISQNSYLTEFILTEGGTVLQF